MSVHCVGGRSHAKEPNIHMTGISARILESSIPHPPVTLCGPAATGSGMQHIVPQLDHKVQNQNIQKEKKTDLQ